ncbi:MAG TPA: hypothetical protein VL022_09885 [Moheibacter sp.]|nr:hypothetical protein [Moheibacter sp.]
MLGQKSMVNLFFRKRYLPFLGLGLVLACAKFEDVELTDQNKNIPTRTLVNAEVVFKDSGFIKINLLADLIEEFGMVDTPYTLFSKGLELNFYTKSIDSPGYLRANWALTNDIKGWYEGRGDVVVINEVGDTLKTQQLFWNKKERKIFTQDTVYIITKTGDSLQANDGLEAKDDLTEYMLFNNHGIKFYEEEDQ